jgi:hypothetical protein
MKWPNPSVRRVCDAWSIGVDDSVIDIFDTYLQIRQPIGKVGIGL